jgi:hypothetical protein
MKKIEEKESEWKETKEYYASTKAKQQESTLMILIENEKEGVNDDEKRI